jgi:hypothetical protein
MRTYFVDLPSVVCHLTQHHRIEKHCVEPISCSDLPYDIPGTGGFLAGRCGKVTNLMTFWLSSRALHSAQAIEASIL